MFLRGRLHLAYHLPRARQNANSVRVSLDPSSEPDFTKYPPVATLMATAIETVSCSEVQQKKNSFDMNPPSNNLQEDSSMIEYLRRQNTTTNTANMSKQLQLQSIINEITLSTTTKRQQKYTNVLKTKKLKKLTTTTTTDDSSSIPKSRFGDDDNNVQKLQNKNLEKSIEQIIPKKIRMKSSSTERIKAPLKHGVNQKEIDIESISSNDTINSDMIEFLSDVDL